MSMADDWYPGLMPSNISVEEQAYIGSSYSFIECFSQRPDAVRVGRAGGVYRNSILMVGPSGRVDIGPCSCLNGTTVICQDVVVIGSHCLLAWGVMITDTWLGRHRDRDDRRRRMIECADASPRGTLPVSDAVPVVIEDNVWIGFGAVVLPGVRLGRGSVVGCKTVVAEDVPPYAVVAGNPARVIRFLSPECPESRPSVL